jgi:muramoyltetrapeptide carboxypeptidase
MLTQLRLSGALDRASGIIVGELPRCDEPDGSFVGRSTVAAALRDFAGPIVIGFPCGHTNAPAVTVPLGVRARLVARGEPKLLIEEAAVE